MGDPGVPVILGLLAVPVGVLLFVVALALMGRRWTPAVPLDEPAPDLDAAEPGPADEPAPFDWGFEPRPAWPGPDRALPAPRARLALPPARPRYDTYSGDSYSRDSYSDTYSGDSFEPEPSSEQAFPYGPYRHQ